MGRRSVRICGSFVDIMVVMKCVVQKFSSHEEAEAAERKFYHSLTPLERVDILLELLASQRAKDGTATGLARVCRIVKRG